MEEFLVVPVLGSPYVLQLEDHDDLLDQAYEIIGCKWVEFVHCGDYILLVDDLGKVMDPVKPENPRASLLYPGTDFGDPIVGNCLIGAHGFRHGEPDIVGLSPAQIQILRGFFLAVGDAH